MGSPAARAALERDLSRYRAQRTLAPPRGWVRAIRDALGMSTRELAARMGRTSSWVSKLEQNEAAGTITLQSLRSAADALDCDLEYVLMPRRPLEESVRSQARHKARAVLGSVEHTMALEGQAVALDAEVEALADELMGKRGLWSTP